MSLTRLAHGRERQGQPWQSRHQWRHQRLSKWKQWSCRRIQINANIWVYLGSLTWHSLALRYCLEHSLSEDSWIHSCSARLEWRENRIRQNRLMMAGWCLRIVNPRVVAWPLNPGTATLPLWARAPASSSRSTGSRHSRGCNCRAHRLSCNNIWLLARLETNWSLVLSWDWKRNQWADMCWISFDQAVTVALWHREHLKDAKVNLETKIVQ